MLIKYEHGKSKAPKFTAPSEAYPHIIISVTTKTTDLYLQIYRANYNHCSKNNME